MLKATTALVAIMTINQPAPALASSKVCGERSKILAQLEKAHNEVPHALGLSSDGSVIEVLVSPDGGWTMLITYPDKPTCVIGVGEAWQSILFAGGQVS